jgi:hypothetical protein
MEVHQQLPTMDIPSSTHPRDETMMLDSRDNGLGVNNHKLATTTTRDAAGVGVRTDVFGGDGTKKLSVLLVEDDHATLVFVKALLRSCGHTGEQRQSTEPQRDGLARHLLLVLARGGNGRWGELCD